MRARKTTAITSKSRSTQSRRSTKSRSGQTQRLQAALKKSNETRKNLQKRIATLNSEWKEKLRKVEHDVLEKAKAHFEREHVKRESARKKAVDAAVAKFEKKYTKKTTKKGRSSRSVKRSQASKARASSGKRKASAK